jgi:hypothetical protein
MTAAAQQQQQQIKVVVGAGWPAEYLCSTCSVCGQMSTQGTACPWPIDFLLCSFAVRSGQLDGVVQLWQPLQFGVYV